MELKNSSSQMEMVATVGGKISEKIIEGAEKTNTRSSSACIYRVGRELRALKPSAYTPHLVSIGPFHSKDKYLKKRSGDIKLSYVKSLFDRIPNHQETNEWRVPKPCPEKMKELVDEAKKCYAEEVGGELNEEMLLIDGCFILEFLYRYAEFIGTNQSECTMKGDPIFGSVPTRLTVQDDLLLLENQLPFFVLQTLYDLTLKTLQNPLHDSLDEYVYQIIPKLDPVSNSENNTKNNPTKSGSLRECHCCVILVSDKNKQNNDSAGEDDSKKEPPKHILDFIHKKHRPPPNSVPDGKDHHHHHHEKINTCSKFMYSASDLHYAGVKFEAGAPDNIFKVSFKEVNGLFHLFHRARFQIPTLHIDDSTERLLRNLIAFEQCHPGVEYCYVSSYAVLMDRLINTAKDVEVLQKAGVIHNYLRANEEASDIFNKLCMEVVLGKRGFYYAQTCEDAALYSERLWPEFMAYVRYSYFSKPWTFLAFCIAFIVFGVTMGNFILNLYRNPPNK